LKYYVCTVLAILVLVEVCTSYRLVEVCTS